VNGSATACPDLTYRAARVPPRAPVVVGSEADEVLFCTALLDSFEPYRPAVLDWPERAPEG
jgi:hypothetical protein